MADSKDPQELSGDSVPPAGRIAHDARGNAVWQWSKPGNRQAAADSTSRMLRRLEVPGLSLQDDESPVRKGSGPPPKTLKVRREEGFNPYDDILESSSVMRSGSGRHRKA